MIDGKTNTVAAQITGLFQPEAIAVDPATHTVYAFAGENGGEDAVVINGTTVTAFVAADRQGLTTRPSGSPPLASRR